MANTWLLVIIAFAIIILLVIAIIAAKSRTKKLPVDYQSWFIMGVIWTALGIPLKNAVLSILGIVFMITSITHKKEWTKNHKANQWKNLSEREQKIKSWLMIVLGILFLIGIAAFFFVAKGRI